ncbi:putative transposase of IS630 family insertion sequence ISY100h [Nitrosococcus oceani ATCC 19707]|uniref:Transposase of IS630 family insertion sequence ISY100h n=5 Tax=Nitrosococcus oceani TaxID=1229 RepID=Q3JE94_NITOC|nr:putative transposase of IS630 family insertion sequence ISY100h [Nitrosococcus oceani ATCC 19707]EDZ65415.1 hypothetical protein NOC27_2095 [Nitrosococcus oceani AFC27]ABA56852.1 putative transposase of IS630 family insertion sequence ISY100h [Nitrosococcus oceani ATCC 19707]ABA57216.1 putative transposase of IS630 family insertion sequence ISY100h [Nitrosococcus oceani ATCC 19707]ABA57373.1 putative transposase of IS630 family insertion sequence ISY100h [Nitrosococcus oceani ATCC 19707]
MTGYTQRCNMKRKSFLRLRERYRRRGKRFVYLDESGFEPEVSRRYAYAPKGRRVYGLISGHRRPRTSLLAARMDEGFEAPFLFEGTCNTAVFNAWLEKELCPLLNSNHIVIMDNAPFHKAVSSREIIKKTGAGILFLPPYSPDFNPIEKDFGNIKKIREYNEHETLENIVAAYQ